MDVSLKQKIINRIAHAGENPLFVCVSRSEVVRAGLEEEWTTRQTHGSWKFLARINQ